MQFRDYYQTLGVNRNATDKEIKQAYRKLARQFHPDVNKSPDAAAQFQRVTEAYEVLSDAQKRQRYDDVDDNYRTWRRTNQTSDFDWSRWTQGPRANDVEFDSAGSVFSDFFRSIFSDGGRRSNASASPNTQKQPIDGRDLEVDVHISLPEAYTGTTRQVNRTGSRAFTARIPPGVRTGTKVRFENQGERGFAGGRTGSLYVNIFVDEHPQFERRDDDIHMDIEVSVYTAVLGGDIRISTLGGDLRLKIPPGTQSGKVIRLRERGMPCLREPDCYGDLYARVAIQIPTDLSEEERALFERLAALRPRF
ncbi:MAG: DnaJ C-terminal domain-containing protein [Anaerolineales bacterium]